MPSVLHPYLAMYYLAMYSKLGYVLAPLASGLLARRTVLPRMQLVQRPRLSALRVCVLACVAAERHLCSPTPPDPRRSNWHRCAQRFRRFRLGLSARLLACTLA